MRKTCAAVIVAAGSARRMGGIDKVMADLGGQPVLLRTVRAMADSESIDEIVVVTRPDLRDVAEALCAGIPKFRAVVCGGESRTESVMAGLEAISPQTELVAVQDGARPLVSRAVIDGAIQAATEFGAAAPAIAVHDTIKTARNGVVTATPDRSTLFAVQTPQVFSVALLRSALEFATQNGIAVTDDCSAVEALGVAVHLTCGSEENLKITTPTDLLLAQCIWQRRAKNEDRTRL